MTVAAPPLNLRSQRKPKGEGHARRAEILAAAERIFVEHGYEGATIRKIADEVAMLHEGRIIWRGPVSALDNSGNPHIDQFVNGRAEGPIQPAI